MILLINSHDSPKQNKNTHTQKSWSVAQSLTASSKSCNLPRRGGAPRPALRAFPKAPCGQCIGICVEKLASATSS